MSDKSRGTERLLQRPIYGGVFGEDGRYALASMPCVSRGLYATRYMVVQSQAGVVLSIADDKTEALAGARKVLHAANDMNACESAKSCANQGELWPQVLPPMEIPAEPRYASRRRREIFDRSAGKCHYCRTPLTLDGKWHVEHQQPRALGGGDDPLNLVAACVSCNLAKSDRTALEFVVGRAAG
jgi:hypothetical protein